MRLHGAQPPTAVRSTRSNPPEAHLLHAPHVVGTRLARFGWYERNVLPRFAALANTRAARFTGHFVAFLAVAR